MMKANWLDNSCCCHSRNICYDGEAVRDN